MRERHTCAAKPRRDLARNLQIPGETNGRRSNGHLCVALDLDLVVVESHILRRRTTKAQTNVDAIGPIEFAPRSWSANIFRCLHRGYVSTAEHRHPYVAHLRVENN